MNKITRIKKIITSLFLIVLLCGLFIQPIQAQEAFTIDDATINLDVHEDGSIDVVETYTLNFLQSRHGFYRDIPNIYNMKMEVDGKIEHKKYYFPVSDVSCTSKCEVEASTNAVRIKLGDADRKVIGNQQYSISYQVQTKDLRLSNQVQALYWNLIGNFDTTISKFSYKITMPKAFDASKVYTSTGMDGNFTDLLTFETKGNVISGTLTNPLYNYESATIRVDLANGYFTFPEVQDYTMLCSIIAGIILLLSLVLFWKFGKDDDIIVTVEFQAPKDLNSAEVGYIIDDAVQNKDIISLIIDWANRGFLKIYDHEKSYELEKLKEMDKRNSKAYERRFFHAIFKDREHVNEAQLKEQHVYTALQNSKELLRNMFHAKKRQLYSKTSITLQIIMIFLIVLVNLLFTYLAANETYGLLQISIPYLIPSLLLGLVCIPWIIFMRKRYVIQRKMILWIVFGITLIDVVLLFVQIIVQYNAGVSLIGLFVCSIFTVCMMILMMFMDKRTKQANEWLGQILGLKEFIITCEKEQLEMFVNDNPTVFYAVLPYAYVLGITDVWVKKFEGIAMQSPDWYVTDSVGMFTTVLWWNHFHYCFSSISTAASYTPPSSGSGGGSFGSGGFGGGGFAGGGFGGGGGGSW